MSSRSWIWTVIDPLVPVLGWYALLHFSPGFSFADHIVPKDYKLEASEIRTIDLLVISALSIYILTLLKWFSRPKIAVTANFRNLSTKDILTSILDGPGGEPSRIRLELAAEYRLWKWLYRLMRQLKIPVWLEVHWSQDWLQIVLDELKAIRVNRGEYYLGVDMLQLASWPEGDANVIISVEARHFNTTHGSITCQLSVPWYLWPLKWLLVTLNGKDHQLELIR